MRKKMLSLLLVGTMLTGVLTGCGGNSATEQTASADTSTNTVAETAKTDAETKTEETKVSDEDSRK